MTEDYYIGVKTVAKRFSVSVSTIWRWSSEGSFPKPTKLGSATTRWRESDLRKFEAERNGVSQ